MINRAIVTGASGMLGQALIRYLTMKNIEVLAVIRPNSERNSGLYRQQTVIYRECDLDKLLSLQDSVDGEYDAFFHFGWAGTFGGSRNNMYGQCENIRYTLDAVELAKAAGCKVFLGAGSQAEYGRVYNQKLSSDTPTFPETAYGAAKLCAGSLSRLACNEYGIRHIWTRILSVYGPGDKPYTMVMSGIISMINGESPKYTKGEQQWDYIHCDDAARAFYLLAENGRDGIVYPIGSGQVRKLREYIELIGKYTNPDLSLLFGEVPYYDKQVMYLCADISDLTADTGFVPKITFEEGIQNTIAWCREEYKNVR